MSDTPIISIAMPVYNCQNTVAQTIRSILSQTFTDWELLIVNDGSSDNTLQVVQQFHDPRIRFWSHNKNLGLSARLNETIEQSRGEFYARMDGDDIAYPFRLEKQLDFLRSRPELDLIGSWMIVFGKSGIPIGKNISNLDQNSHNILRTIPIHHPTFFGRLEWFKKNFYSEFPRNFQDQFLLLTTIQNSQFAILPEILLGYREESLKIRKQFRYRWSYIQSLSGLVHELGMWHSFALVGFQLVKFCVDVFAIGTGLNYHILRHRAYPVTTDERKNWQGVWKSVS